MKDTIRYKLLESTLALTVQDEINELQDQGYNLAMFKVLWHDGLRAMWYVALMYKQVRIPWDSPQENDNARIDD